MNKHIVIIGAGISGMTAGIYAKRSGFEVIILEQHTIPGGMCTSWRRKGYLFEGAMHWLTGSSPKTFANELWRDVGALDDSTNVRYDEVFRSVEWEGKTYYLYRDLDKLKEHFDTMSKEDAEMTASLIADIKAFSKCKMPISDIKGVKCATPHKMNAGVMLKMIPLMPNLTKKGNMSVLEYVSQFKHPALRLLLGSVVTEEYNALSLMFTLATVTSGDGGYPEGGSLGMAQRMADKFTGMGGKIIYGTKVDKVIAKNGTVVGVRLKAQAETPEKIMEADAVVVTQETLAAAEQLFEIQLHDEWLSQLKRDTKPAACCFVSIGVKTVIKETPAFVLDKPIKCGGLSYSTIAFTNYSDYKGYAPDGCMSLTVFLGGDSYDFWKTAKEEGKYEAEKQNVADQIVEVLNKKHPQTMGLVEVVDVATPLTYERYTSASHGSWMSIMGKGDSSSMSPCPCTLEEIKGVYFAGHRTMSPGGMPVALSSGRSAAQMVCRQFDTEFK